MGKEPGTEQFLKDIQDHKMIVLMDNNIHRHLRFQKTGTGINHFEIVTFPGYLVYVGDMGAYTFARLTDMFQFFRRNDDLSINPHYWAEKLEAVDNRCHNPGYKEYSEEKFRAVVEEHVNEWIEEFEGEYDSDEEEIAEQREAFAGELCSAIEDDVLCRADDGEQAVHEALRDFSCEIKGQKYEFSDTWEWDFREYTYRFLWCCYAIVWAIKQYDEHKSLAGASV